MPKSTFSFDYGLLRSFLVQMREKSGLTQVEAANRLGKPQSYISKYERGERRLDLIELMALAKAIGFDPLLMIERLANREHQQTILDKWQVSPQELTDLVHDNPSLRGVLLGYIAEKKLRDIFLGYPQISELGKADDHDRKKKGDCYLKYKDQEIVVEVKSLQTNTKEKTPDGSWRGKTQVDASDKRPVLLPNGETISTTCLVTGEFDLLAVNLFAFEEKWRFVFAKNDDLPRSNWKGYTPKQRKYLLATLMEVTWPPKPPFYQEPFPLLDAIARERTRKGLARPGSLTKTKK